MFIDVVVRILYYKYFYLKEVLIVNGVLNRLVFWILKVCMMLLNILVFIIVKNLCIYWNFISLSFVFRFILLF